MVKNENGVVSMKKCVCCGESIAFGQAIGIANADYICKSCFNKYGFVEKYPTRRSYKLIRKKEALNYVKAGGVKIYENLSDSEKLDLYIVDNPSIPMKNFEICYYEWPAFGLINTKRTERVTRSQGVSVSYLKGVSKHVGESISTPVTHEYLNKESGTLFITNKRMILQAAKKSFEIPMIKITNMQGYTDAFEVYAGGKYYRFGTTDPYTIADVITLMNAVYGKDNRTQAEKDYENAKEAAKNKSENLKELRELKKLLDDEIITEDDYNKKKKQLLGI